MKKLIALFSAVLLAGSAYAGGYQIAVQGQKMVAMGHTGVGIVLDASSVYFNPAALPYLNDSKWNFALGASFVLSNGVYRDNDTQEEYRTDNPTGTPFNFYGSYNINDRWSVALGIYTPFGSSLDWGQGMGWTGSHMINNIKLSAIYFQPTVAFRVSEKFSLGAGVIYARGGVNLNRNLSQLIVGNNGRPDVTLDSDANGWGFQVGAYFQDEKFSAGITYKSTITAKAEGGDADFENVPASLPIQFDDTTFSAELPLPGSVNVGLGYNISSKWLVAADFNYTFWSAYEELLIDFDSDVPDSQNPRNYKDSYTIRIGTQYLVSEHFALRGGFYYDTTPVREGYFTPETPSNNSFNYTGGFSYIINDKISIDASLLFVNGQERTDSYDYFVEPLTGQEVAFEGTYKFNALVPSVGMSFAF